MSLFCVINRRYFLEDVSADTLKSILDSTAEPANFKAIYDVKYSSMREKCKVSRKSNPIHGIETKMRNAIEKFLQAHSSNNVQNSSPNCGSLDSFSLEQILNELKKRGFEATLRYIK